MSNEPDFIGAVTRQHQRQIDAAAERGEQFAELKDELANDMTRALAGLQNGVPGYAGGTSTTYPREVVKPVASMVYDALDTQTVLGELLMVLKDSTCPLVDQLRKAVIDQYVNDVADGVAEARGLV